MLQGSIEVSSKFVLSKIAMYHVQLGGNYIEKIPKGMMVSIPRTLSILTPPGILKLSTDSISALSSCTFGDQPES